jgi:crotonobetainyl-CoA:carnitine CoA-transferase CaiB-like acyl-CoA transferase
MGGLMSVTGRRARDRDDAPAAAAEGGRGGRRLFTGMYAAPRSSRACATATARRGQAIDMALLDTQVAMLANLGAELPDHRRRAAAPGQRAPEHRAVPGVRGGRRPHDPGGRQRHQFAKFCEVAGAPELATDPRYARNAGRVRERATLVPISPR